MTMAAFQDAAPAWAAAGIVPLPIAPDGKRPLVKHPDTFRRPGAMALAAKPRFADANLGFWCGSHNGLTVVDIDSPTDAELQYALSTYGDSPILVKTASGKHHAYYRHDGERRRIKPDKAHPIDILGEGGICVAPPSTRPAGGTYAFLRGGLADIANGALPKIRAGAIQNLEPAPTGKIEAVTGNSATIEQGERNARLLRLTCALALHAETKADLLEQSRRANAELCNPPLPDAEVQGAVGSAWRYKMNGTLMVRGMESSTVLPTASIARLLAAGETDACLLLFLLRKSHSGKRTAFAASPEAMERSRQIGSWSKRRYREAIRKLCDAGELAQISQGGKGKHTPSLYRFGRRGLV